MSKKSNFTSKLTIELCKPNKICTDTWNKWNTTQNRGTVYNSISYLNIICPSWQTIVVSQQGVILAFYPVAIKNICGVKIAIQPVASQYFSILLSPNIGNNKKIEIIDSILTFILKNFLVFNQKIDPYSSQFVIGKKNSNLKIYRTSILNKETNLSFSSSVLTQIKKAKKQNLTVISSNEIEWLLNELLQKNYFSKKEKYIYEKIFYLYKSVEVLCAINNKKEIVSACMFLGFQNSTTYLLSVTKSNCKNLGTNSLILYNKIKSVFSQFSNPIFDFEGSNIPSIQNYFNRFNVQNVPYIGIKKGQLLVLFLAIKKKIANWFY